jgi:hypothetical protein
MIVPLMNPTRELAVFHAFPKNDRRDGENLWLARVAMSGPISG